MQRKQLDSTSGSPKMGGHVFSCMFTHPLSLSLSFSRTLRPSGREQTRKRPQDTSLKEGTGMGAFFEQFPVTMDGQAPSKRQRQEKGLMPDRSMYDKWRSQQRKLRQKSTHTPLPFHDPTGPGKSPWCRQSAVTLRTWAGPPTSSPPRRLDSATYSYSGKRLRPDPAHQGSELAGTLHSGEQDARCRKRWVDVTCWFGLFATKAFSRVEVICDYHGGQRAGVCWNVESCKHSYMNFFRAREQKLCMNSQTAP
ncbi:hypothetical protein CRENBAI_011613 [Crenichthys baileyi]|uniref:Uncharacterized protein n=1 Tax=Crenichthys baileyi TaxID=28760 RepID=A0AAV9SIN7_9TELE